jgi:hypothetical protein
VAFKYGANGFQFISDGAITITAGGKCNDSQWCGGGDPNIPTQPPVTQPPSGTYFCRTGEFGPCEEQASPCGAGQTTCTQLEQI